MTRRFPLRPLLLIAFALGIFFRLSGLENKMYSHDEAYTSLRAAGYTESEVITYAWNGKEVTANEVYQFLQPGTERDIVDTLTAIARSEPQHSPLYFLLAHYWMRLCGYSPGTMRSLAALLSLFAIPAMYWLSLALFKSRSTALLSAVLISLSPYQLLFAQDARPYSLLASITLVSSAAFIVALHKNRNGVWGIYLLSLIIGLYSHQLFAFVGVAHGIYLAIVQEYHQGGRVAKYLAASLLALLTFTPWLLQLFMRWDIVISGLRWSSNQIHWSQYIQRWALIFAAPFIDLQFGPKSLVPYLLRAPVLLFIGYALFYLVISTPRRVWAFLLVGLGVMTLPIILSDLLRGGILSIQGRYFASANVITIPVVAHLMAVKLGLPGTASRNKWYLITCVLLVAQIISGFNSLWAQTWWNKTLSSNHPQVVNVLNQANQPLLVVNGIGPTDLGDVLALSLMVDQDVRFKLHQKRAVVELPSGYSDIYWFQHRYTQPVEFADGKNYRVTEVVPWSLWRIDEQTQ